AQSFTLNAFLNFKTSKYSAYFKLSIFFSLHGRSFPFFEISFKISSACCLFLSILLLFFIKKYFQFLFFVAFKSYKCTFFFFIFFFFSLSFFSFFHFF